MSLTPTFATVAEFRHHVENNPAFVPSPPTKATKLKSVTAYTFRGTQQVLFGFGDNTEEKMESRIIHPSFTVTPSTGAITRFTPTILQRLETRDDLVSADLQKSTNVTSGEGWLTKPTEAGVYLFVSAELSSAKVNAIVSILQTATFP